MAQATKPLVQVKSFFKPQEEIDQEISVFLMDKKLSKEDFEDSWTVCEWMGKVYCLVRIYYKV